MPKKKVYEPEVKKLLKEIEELKTIIKSKKKEIKEIQSKEDVNMFPTIEKGILKICFD